MLTEEQTETIQLEVMQNRPLSVKTKEAEQFRSQLEQEKKQAEKDGVVWDM